MSYSLEIPQMTEAEMLSVVSYLRENNISYWLQEFTGDCEWSDEDKIKRIPTKHFSSMCGNECLNKEGKVSKKDAYYILEHFVKIHAIHEENGIIYIDPWIQKLIKETRATITKRDLRAIVNRFFE
jgi:hypothetical protein